MIPAWIENLEQQNWKGHADVREVAKLIENFKRLYIAVDETWRRDLLLSPKIMKAYQEVRE